MRILIAEDESMIRNVVCHAKRKKLTSKMQKIRQRKNFLADLKHI